METTTACVDCPLRKRDCFRQFDAAELDYVSRLKSGELRVAAGATVLEQGTSSTHVYTVLEGSGYRLKSLDDGRQQILNFVLPGDLIGLQAALFGAMEHSIETLTDMRLCVFQRSDMRRLFSDQPDLSYTVVWHAARGERMLDEHLVSVGRRTARERIAYTLITLHDRARRIGLAGRDGEVKIPLRQHHLADALGLSVVHTNKTLGRLSAAGLVAWHSGQIVVKDRTALCEIARYDGVEDAESPLI